MSRIASRVLTGARSFARSQFARDFAQGAIEDELQERMFPGRSIQTGPPTVGGATASILRKLVFGSAPAVAPHTNRQVFAHYQAQGIPMQQAAAVMRRQPMLIDSRTLQNFVSRGIISSEEMAIVQREFAARQQARGMADVVKEQFSLDDFMAEQLASLTTVEIATRASDRD